jgi:hypothetical protein
MDQVRKILGWLKKNHFWVLSVLIALVSVFCWWRASGAMKKQFAENKSKIDAGFSSVSGVLGDTFHPNATVYERQKQEISKLSDEVAKLWQQLYDVQSEGVLIWPSGPGQLSADFVKEVEKLEFGAEIEDRWREHYQNYIFNHFPKLPEKVGARAILEGTAAAGGGMGFSRMGRSQEGPGANMTMGGELEDDGNYICEWASDNQTLVRQELEFPQIPSSLRVWCTQENMWVYHTLLDAIKNTNQAANATRISNAAVRGIYSLQVGQTAAPFSRQPNRILKLATAAPVGGAEAGFGAEGPGMGVGGPEASMGAEALGGREFGVSGLALGMTGEMSEEQERTQLLHGRYLGEDGKPIPYGAAASPDAAGEPVDTSIPAPPLDLSIFGKEYKRLPVRMVLEMDQRHLPKLIAECAMRPLQIEVQEVRVNAPDILSGAGGGGGMRSMNFSEGGGMSGNLMPDLTGLQQFNPQPEIVTVAIQGVIYIFNKPNMELLKPPGEEGATDGSVATTQ